MNTRTCARLFEVEALRDGRLGGAARRSFEGHLSRCKVCSEETRALEALGRALQLAEAGAASDELHVRRERTRLLAAFDRVLLARERPRRRVWPSALALATALLLLGVLLVPKMRSPDPVKTTSALVRADASAEWSTHTRADREVIFLERGALWIRVAPSDQRSLLVLLPDGQLEDIGTTFSVRVQAGRTTHVDVEEGSVLLRLRGKPQLAIGAGERWRSETVAGAAPAVKATPHATSTPPSAAPNAVSAPAREAPALPRARSAAADPATATAREASALQGSAPAVPNEPLLRNTASEDFRAAMAALDAGQHREAAARLRRFVTRHPADARAQDAAYMRVIALQRAGDQSAMQKAAREYLARFPAGFRRAEVEKLTK